MYKRHRVQLSIPQKEEKTLLDFSCKLAESLIKANKTVASSSRGQPTKRKNDIPKKMRKKKYLLLLCHDVCHNGVGHWPVANSSKSCCRKCQKHCRMVCEKCNSYLCLLEEIVSSCSTYNPKCYLHQFCTTQTNKRKKM